MPIQRCQKNGKPGFKFGKEGFCYTYTQGNARSRREAKKKAKEQAAAIKASQSK